MTVRPSQALYNLLTTKLQQADDELAAAKLLAVYEVTEIPGFEPKTVWEEEYGPKNGASKVPHGVKLERAIANAEAKVVLLSALVEDWTAQEQAWLAEQPVQEPAF